MTDMIGPYIAPYEQMMWFVIYGLFAYLAVRIIYEISIRRMDRAKTFICENCAEKVKNTKFAHVNKEGFYTCQRVGCDCPQHENSDKHPSRDYDSDRDVPYGAM